jgi:hypothetical protein
MPAQYNGTDYRTELEATWAAFFDAAGWRWTTNPSAIGNWKQFSCTHSECSGQHTLLVAVLPLNKVEQFGQHPALNHCYGAKSDEGHIVADAGAVFGDGPWASLWTMSHGAGGGNGSVSEWVHDSSRLWVAAGKSVKKG